MSEASPAPEGAPRKSRKGLIIAIAGTVLLGCGGGAWFAFAGKKDEAGTEAPAEVMKLPAQFVALDPPFVVNFQAGAQARFLQIAVQLMTRDVALAASLEHLKPIIRNDLLLLFGNKQVEEVSTHEGKEALRAATLDAVRKIISAEGGKGEALEAVYFTSFVMQ
jgi:flagellar FliL protein